MEFLKLILKGIALGVANVIPGVSGGTMAVVFNVYDRIIALITPNLKKIFGEWKFWLPLLIGMAAGILAFSRIITVLMERFPVPTEFFFAGLILGSVPLIFRKMRTGKLEKPSPAPVLAVCFLIGLLLVLSMLVFGCDAEGAKAAAKLSAETGEMDALKAALLFVSGAAAAVAMIIPGISGSFLLLALGMYGTIMAAISSLSVLFLLPFALGVLAGLVFGAALVRVLMKRIPAQTYAAILGLVTGSIALIFRGFSGFGGAIFLLASLAALAAGFCAAFFSSRGEK